ncbi:MULTISPECIES: Bug family tripartite tricarboxylate transporter substrate binding protein [Nocardiaceae]|nr:MULTISPECIES: tripartite tricarboxylate transporter substrate-binding protein [Rhodococcus]AMY20890.1 hypothetical protein A3Q40_03531 [Rhodococcus sp. PBTS 1]
MTDIRRVRRGILVMLTALTLALSACGGSVTSMVTGATQPGLRIIAPSVAGGGYDLTARSVSRAWAAQGVAVDDVLVLPGSGGVVGLGRLAAERGNEHLLLMMGLGLVGALATIPSEYTLDDVTPIARLVTEPEVVLVPAASPLRTLDDLVARWRADDDLRFGGGSATGGPDGLFRTRLARAIGVDPDATGYRVFDGGGELLPALLTGEVDVATTGVSEYLDQLASGTVRALAVSSDDAVAGVDAPTLREEGVDLVFDNWRGLMAPPGLPPDRVRTLIRQVGELVASDDWARLTERNGWQNALLTGDDFRAFLRDQADMVAATLDPAA